MREIIFILSVIGFMVAFFKIEIYFIRKSREKFLEAGRAWKELKEAEQDLHKLLKDKELEK
jgi:hypothetical protein